MAFKIPDSITYFSSWLWASLVIQWSWREAKPCRGPGAGRGLGCPVVGAEGARGGGEQGLVGCREALTDSTEEGGPGGPWAER